MPRDAQGNALIEVGGPEDEIRIESPAGIEVTWLHRGASAPGTTTLLADAVRAVPWRDGKVQVFAHGERGAMKGLRPCFTEERGLDRADLSLSAYWAHGRREDTFQAEKRTPVGVI